MDFSTATLQPIEAVEENKQDFEEKWVPTQNSTPKLTQSLPHSKALTNSQLRKRKHTHTHTHTIFNQ